MLMKNDGTRIIGKKSWNFVISPGILPILSRYFTNLVPFLGVLRNFSSVLESLHFQNISANYHKCEV